MDSQYIYEIGTVLLCEGREPQHVIAYKGTSEEDAIRIFEKEPFDFLRRVFVKNRIVLTEYFDLNSRKWEGATFDERV